MADRGRSEPNEARFCGGGGAIIGPGEPCDAAGAGGGVWLVMGALGAAGGDAEAGADAGVIWVAAGGGVGFCGAVGTEGGSGLTAPAERPLVKPCERSLAAVVGVGRPAGVVGVAGMLGVLGMGGIGGGRIEVPPVPDNPETGLIGGMMPEQPPGDN